MLLQSLLTNTTKPKEDANATPRPDHEPSYGRGTKSGETVSVFSSQCIATAYRCKNIISDAVANMPLKQYRKAGENTLPIDADPITRNLPFLTLINPNLWGWTPFQMKKAFMEWLLFYGNGYIWKPPISPAQLFVLPSNKTRPLLDLEGNLWYEHKFPNSPVPAYLPSVEVLHLLINPDETGMMGRGVITFARETYGRRQAANKAQAMLFAQGFMPAGIVKLNGPGSLEIRDTIRAAYEKSMSGTDNAYRLAIMDNKIESFTPVDLQLKDSNWLESISATDDDIALFFGMAGHMLNRGKEAYNSNEEKFSEFVTLTLDPFLVPFEEAARIRWISQAEQTSTFFKFKREALYRMKAKERAEMNSIKIQSGQMTPNEAIGIEDGITYPLGNQHFMMSNVQPIGGTNNGNPPA
jgi:HK97 family phage portal protein